MHRALKIIARRALPLVALAAAACVHPTSQFERYLAREDWIEAARAFDADTTLRGNEHLLYDAGVLFGTPGRATYDPEKARETWRSFLMRFPTSERRTDAEQRLSLVEDVLDTRRDAASREQDLEDRIAQLTRETQTLRARVDSLTTQGDSLHNALTRADADRRADEAQLNALRLELQRLKEIDLKPHPPVRPIKP